MHFHNISHRRQQKQINCEYNTLFLSLSHTDTSIRRYILSTTLLYFFNISQQTAVWTDKFWVENSYTFIISYIEAQVGESGGYTPTPFTIFTITYKVVMYAPAERADAPPLFLLHPYTYSVHFIYMYFMTHLSSSHSDEWDFFWLTS